MSEFEVGDEQREAAVAYLRDEHTRGAFDFIELERRTTAANQARTVAELLAATAPAQEVGHPSAKPVARNNTLALVGGVAVAVLLILVVLSRLGG
jgi:hypothetical protein